MKGVIAIDKPSGWTSFDVIAKCRGILKERRLGHSGTLDPMATGVLPVFIGAATKAADMLPDQKKKYLAKFVLGYSTDTQDVTGEKVRESDVRVDRSDIERELDNFRGVINQLPPMYSAVRIGGQRLYDLARRGIEVERTPRIVEIFDIRLTDFDFVSQTGGLEVVCSKGTYIRTIINDLGERLKTFAAMSALRRTFSQGFGISECVSLEKLQSLADEGRIAEVLKPLDRCFECYPEVRLTPAQEKMYKNGVTLDSEMIGAEHRGIYRIYGGGFLGLGKSDGEGMRPYKNFWGTSE